MKPDNKTILVTGATGGIGSLLSSLLSRRGATLILTGHSHILVNDLKDALGERHVAVAADLSKTSGRAEVIEACHTAGGIDALVNLAGIMDFNLFDQQDEATVERLINVNLVGVLLLCRGLIPMLKQRPEAVLINVGSIFGSIGYPGFAAYCASKAGIRCFTEALSRELADTSVQVSYIAPRATSTSLNSDRINALNAALGNKSDSPEYVARQIVSLFMRKRRARYLGWPERFFVRLNALMPGLVQRALTRQLPLIKQFASQ